MRHHIWLFAVVAAVVSASWWWLGRPIPVGSGDPGRIPCLSYAPFRGNESPLVASTQVSAADIRADLTNLARVTNCVRTYSIENGLDQVPQIAGQLGISVIQGLWLSSNRLKNRAQIDATVALARQYPSVISAVVVGNEVLLRGELSAEDILAVLHEVKAAVPMPVTYADVWEYWLRNRELAAAVDFVTVHILPYWEDFPIPADIAGAHVDSIRGRVAAAFPGKDILIGEVGWPSAGRMREGALPSRSNQARVLAEVAARARAGHYRVNFIEAFDQPWKRLLEGTVGGQWGLFTSAARTVKFEWGDPVSDHPDWMWQAAAGVLLAAAIFAGALWGGGAGGRKVAGPGGALPQGAAPQGAAWAGVAVIAAGAGITAPWAVANGAVESLGAGGWVRGVTLAAVAIAAPVCVAMTIAANLAVPGFDATLGPSRERPARPVAWAAGLLLVLVTVLAIQTALGLVFDPRYRDFTFAPLTAAVLPFVVAALLRSEGRTGRAGMIAAVMLAGSSIYIALDEGFQNWQALWFAGVLLVLAVSLVRWRRPRAQST